MTISGTPSRAISTACAWRSWCGAKRRRTPGLAGDAAQFRAGGAGCPRPSARWAVDDAEQRSDRQLYAGLEPWFELFPGPVVDAHLAAAVALAAPHRQ
jgi:hypothetical protein